MSLKSLNVIFIIIILPIILLETVYIKTGLRTIQYQTLYDEGLLSAVSDAIYSFEINTNNDEYSNNPEQKREILKSSVKMFEKSLCNHCGISAYNASDIDEYIPAIVYGLYDGFYMYAPTYTAETNTYSHALSSYVYYTEVLDEENGVVIRYSLDNYVTVSGKFGDKVITRSGYLTYNVSESNNGKVYTYMGHGFDKSQQEQYNYYKEAYEFTNWFNNNIATYNNNLLIAKNNDPEDPNSAFVQHRNQVIKNKMQGVLNSVITAYATKTNGTYKMPKFTEEEWEKIYSNISVTAFFQGKKIGLTTYNGYCILNSTNHNEYPNPNLMYFIDSNGEYHDIRCSKLLDNKVSIVAGYPAGRFSVKKKETINAETKETEINYEYDKFNINGIEKIPTACYNCINGSIDTNQTVYNYITKSDTPQNIKKAYWKALTTARKNMVHY